MSDTFKAKPTKRKDWRSKKKKTVELKIDPKFAEKYGLTRATLSIESDDSPEASNVSSRD